MKSHAFTVGLLASTAAAFSHLISKLGAPQPIAARQINLAAPQGEGALPSVPPPFDAALQRISDSGEHKICDSVSPRS